ncbi:hypothetical protein G7K_6373-t1 [Saitoella complicata NRRL Y-17804]|uniref:Mitochondrial GTPase 1 n=2 Tax=Saitoella complicata (strain BCRC 22490 / CBS 7301 / JCM 7358 / NBRC 10748 / NRRL Y-17804) TaxID=698492 RepID=A0A0E9NR56_SAICN|nr:hypothetical protein G7K_6373-t1 [Saitoella complicata NRRL Y-17804]
MSSFVPRTEFVYKQAATWFPGHMLGALKAMREQMNDIDLVIEARDARLPVSSRNPLLEEAVGARPRLIVYNKKDLAGDALDEKMIRSYQPRQKVMFTHSKNTNNMKQVIRFIKEVAKDIDRPIGTRALVVGMPNVGKSTILNALRHAGVRKGKAARTGNMPGVTRKVAGSVKILEDPVVFLIDTPGVMIPFVPNPLTMLKLALAGCIKQDVISSVTIVDYLLFHLNRQPTPPYVEFFKMKEPTNDVDTFINHVAKHSGRLLAGGVPDVENTALHLIDRYREGKFGVMVLDDQDADAWKRRIEEEEGVMSRGQQQKVIKAEWKAKRENKYVAKYGKKP